MTENRPSTDIAFTPAVKAIQAAKGSRQSYARMESRGGWQNTVTTELADFIHVLHLLPGVADDCRGDAWFDAVELVVDGLDGNVELLSLGGGRRS